MARNTTDERIANLQKKIDQLEARKQGLEARAKEQARKKRTRELIQIGGIMVSVGVDSVPKAQRLLETIKHSPRMQAWIQRIVDVPEKQPTETPQETAPKSEKTNTIRCSGAALKPLRSLWTLIAPHNPSRATVSLDGACPSGTFLVIRSRRAKPLAPQGVSRVGVYYITGFAIGSGILRWSRICC